MTSPAPAERFNIGDRILFSPAGGMLPPMRVLAVRPCETDWNRPEPHDAYKIKDIEGNEDWICGFDAERAR